MILAVMHSNYAIAYGSLEKSGFKRSRFELVTSRYRRDDFEQFRQSGIKREIRAKRLPTIKGP